MCVNKKFIQDLSGVDAKVALRVSVGNTTTKIVSGDKRRARIGFSVAGWNDPNRLFEHMRIGPLIDGNLRPVIVLSLGNLYAMLQVEEYGQLVKDDWYALGSGGTADVSVIEFLIIE